MDTPLAPAPHEHPALGVMVPDSVRTIVVVAHEGELAVALRDKVDRAYAVVRDVRPNEFAAAMSACEPWPWMVVGQLDPLDDESLHILRTRPILIVWWGEEPAGLPRHTRHVARWAELTKAVNDALSQHVEGMRLAVGLGVELPDGGLARSAELQALVAQYPQSFDIPLDAFRSAARVLASQHIPLRPVRDAFGMVTLAAVQNSK